MAIELRNIHFYHSTVIPASRDQVWEVTKNFADMTWHPAAGDTKWADESQTVRVITIPGLGKAIETQIPSPKYSHRYMFSGPSPFPGLSLYEANLRFEPITSGALAGQTFAEWSASAHAEKELHDKMQENIKNVFVSGLDALVARFTPK